MKVKYIGPGNDKEPQLFTLGQVYDARPWDGAESEEERDAFVTVFCDLGFLCVRPLFGKATEVSAEYFQKVSEKPIWETINPELVLADLRTAVKVENHNPSSIFEHATTTVRVALLEAVLELLENKNGKR